MQMSVTVPDTQERIGSGSGEQRATWIVSSKIHPTSGAPAPLGPMTLSQKKKHADYSKSLLLYFMDGTIEQDYQQMYAGKYGNEMLTSFLGIAFAYLAYVVVETTFMFSDRLLLSLVIRVVASVLLIVLVVCAKFCHNMIVLTTGSGLQWALALGVLLVCMSQMWVGLLAGQLFYSKYSIVFLLVPCMASMVTRLSFMVCFFLNFALFLAFLVFVLLEKKLDNNHGFLEVSSPLPKDLGVLATVALFFLANLLFTFRAYQRDYFIREGFKTRATLRDKEHDTHSILVQMLPEKFIKQLQSGKGMTNESYPCASVMFGNIWKFDSHAAELGPVELIMMLNRVFTIMDGLTDEHNVFKVETIGDIYMASANVPDPDKDHAQALTLLAVDIQHVLSCCYNNKVQVRLGVNSGKLSAGVVGSKYPRFRLIGDTVNVASRMSTTVLQPGQIQISKATRVLLPKSSDKYRCISRGLMTVKGKGEMELFLIERKPTAADARVFGPITLTNENEFHIPDPLAKAAIWEKMKSQNLKHTLVPETTSHPPQEEKISETQNLVSSTSQGEHSREQFQKIIEKIDVDDVMQSGRVLEQKHGAFWWLNPMLDYRFIVVRFENDILEHGFEQRFYSQFKYSNDMFLRCFTLYVLGLGVFDLWGDLGAPSPMATQFIVCHVIRLVTVTLALVVVVVSKVHSTSPIRKKYMQILTGLVVLANQLSFVISSVSYDYHDSSYGIGNMILFVALLSITNGVLVKTSTIASISGLLFQVVLSVALRTLSWPALALLLPNTMFIYTNRTSEIYLRRDYIVLGKHQWEELKIRQFLNNMLPSLVMRQISEGAEIIAHPIDDASVLMCDMVGFTTISAKLKVRELVAMLNTIFSSFDALTTHYDIYKVETIGDAYLACVGVVDTTPVKKLVQCGLDFVECATYVECGEGKTVNVRIGIHSGYLIAGVVGRKMPRYHLFGETVTLAQAMESNGVPGRVCVSDVTFQAIQHDFSASLIEAPVTVGGKTLLRYLIDESADRQVAVEASQNLTRKSASESGGDATRLSRASIRTMNHSEQKPPHNFNDRQSIDDFTFARPQATQPKTTLHLAPPSTNALYRP